MGINLERNNTSWSLSEVIQLNGESSATEFAKSMEEMDKKLNEIKKEITYWDVYNITSAITNPDEFDNKIANLEINSSTVINTTYFKRVFEGKETEFYSGDVIIRLKNGDYQHIKAANAGVYVPDLQAFTQDELKTYHDSYEVNQTEGIITYDRTTDKYTWHSDKGYPKNESGNDIYSNHLTITYNYQTTVENTTEKVTTQIASLTGEDSQIYGYVLEPNEGNGYFQRTSPFVFKSIQTSWLSSSTTIVPVIKFFISRLNSNSYQEIYSDKYTLFQDGDNFVFYLHESFSKIVSKVVLK